MTPAPLANFLAVWRDRVLNCRPARDSMIAGISCDSRRAGKNRLFFAIGNGNDFIGVARRAGAWCVGENADCDIVVKDVSWAFIRALEVFWGIGRTPLRLFGVTGTNGKTTTAFCMQRLLGNCGLIGTVIYDDGKNQLKAPWTTPPLERLFELFSAMKSHGLDKCAMELSSHALAQGRSGDFRFEAAVFTNLSGDHLDYHGDMERYFRAKKRMFFEFLAPKGTAVVNIDDRYGAQLAAELMSTGVNCVTFGGDREAAVRLENIRPTPTGTSFELDGRSFQTNLIGQFNIYNLSGAMLAARASGVEYPVLSERLAPPIIVPGRMQKLNAPGRPTVWIDYAHTDDALTKVVGELKSRGRGRLFVVFGAGGDRDRGKRPRMGLAVAGADKIIITSDNPRSEDPETIIDMIASGVPPGRDCVRIADRRNAIELALTEAEESDQVLIAGKGHEDYQEINGRKRGFSDEKTVLEFWRMDT